MIELLVVIAITVILASLLLPALSRAKTRTQSIRCLNNQKQLTLAWTIYSGDHNDALPPNNEMGGFDQASWRSDSPSWVTGNAFSDINTANIRRGVLFPYLNSSETYRCPSDRSTVRNAGKLPRTRHYAMNIYMNGTGDAASNPAWTVATLIFRRHFSIQDPDPANAFVFIDKHPKTMGGGTFIVVQPGSTLDWNWGDFPDIRHENGANLSFADGHVEHWRWKEAATLRLTLSDANPAPKGNRDLRRLQGCIPHPPPL